MRVVLSIDSTEFFKTASTAPCPLRLNSRSTSRNMKILLQSTETLELVSHHTRQSRAGWTTELVDARVFATGIEAVYHCYRHEILNMQMLVVFDDAQQNFTVSVTDTRTA